MSIEIIIPAYKCEKTLDRTLASLEAQTVDTFSVIVVDDCSPDNIKSIVEKHNRLNVRVIRNDINVGCGMSRQVGLDDTIADYVAFLDSDDILMPYAVETWINMAKDAPDIDMFHSYFYEQVPTNERSSLKLYKDGYVWTHGKLYKTEFIRKWSIRNSPEVRWADDSYFNSMCTELGTIGEIHIPLYIWMNNTESVTRSGSSGFNEGCLYDFIHAMRLSAEFVISKNVKTIQHMPYTIAKIETAIHLADDATKAEYDELLRLVKDHMP